MVIDAYDKVKPFGSKFTDSAPWSDITNRLEVVSRITPTMDYAAQYDTLPHALEARSGIALSWFGGEQYVLRGKDAVLAEVLAKIEPVPLVVPMPLEPEVRGKVEEPDIEALLALLVQLGVGEQPELARAYPESLNTDLNLYKAAERLIRLAAVLQSPERVAALDAIVVEVWQSVDVPLTAEQTAVLAQRIEDSAVARPWLAALTDFVDIMTTMVGRSYEDSTASVMSTYVIPRIEAGVLHEQTAAFVGSRLESLGG